MKTNSPKTTNVTNRSKFLIAIISVLMTVTMQNSVKAQDAFTGEIRLVPYNFAPRNWAFCDGSLLPINQNQALFSLLGTTYGGNGTTNFALPDLRGRIPMGAGQGLGLTATVIGETQGSETVSLNSSHLPLHTHSLNVYNGVADTSISTLTNNTHALAIPLTPGLTTGYAFTNNVPTTPLQSASVGLAGSITPTGVPVKQPSLTLNYIICLYGIFPSRN